jgi:DNA-binding transcriptional ArsR family regulator
VDEVFKALADPTRRELLDRLRAGNGKTLQELCEGMSIARQSVSKHLAVLERSRLVTIRWVGREKRHYLNAAPINDVATRWMSDYDKHRADTVSQLKRALEENAMSDSAFVYTTYIYAQPEDVWLGLTDPKFTKLYWGVVLESDWKTGSPLIWHEGDARIEDPEQKVLDSDPPRRLSYTWHAFNMDWARTHGFESDLVERLAAEPRSHVVFDIEVVKDGLVKLTLTHTFGARGTLYEMCAEGWPQLLAGVKTLLETGSLDSGKPELSGAGA